MNQYFDVHHHAVPHFYADALRKAGFKDIDGFPIHDWSVEQSIAFMDRASIGFAVLSLSVPGVDFLKGKDALDLAIQCNDFLSAAQKQYPDRIGFFATVPLDDPSESLAETRRAMDTLGAMGLGLYTNHHGTYPGDERFWPMYEELNSRGACILFHPTRPVEPAAVGLRPPILHYPIDTTYAAAHLLTSGTLNKFSSIHWILSHSGGAVPFLRDRIVVGAAGVGTDPVKLKDYGEAVAALHFDATMNMNQACLKMAADTTSQPLLYGSDYPYLPESLIFRVQQAIQDSGLEMGTLPGARAMVTA